MYILHTNGIGLIRSASHLFLTTIATLQWQKMKKKRLSQLISLLVASTAAQGVLTTHAFATSDVIIDTPSNNLQIDHSANLVHITDTGMLTGAPTTALTVNQDVMVTTLTNDGVINDVVDDSYSPNSNIVQIDGTVDAFNNNVTIASVNQ